MPYRFVDPTDNNKVITFYASGKDKIQVDVYKKVRHTQCIKRLQ